MRKLERCSWQVSDVCSIALCFNFKACVAYWLCFDVKMFSIHANFASHTEVVFVWIKFQCFWVGSLSSCQ